MKSGVAAVAAMTLIAAGAAIATAQGSDPPADGDAAAGDEAAAGDAATGTTAPTPQPANEPLVPTTRQDEPTGIVTGRLASKGFYSEAGIGAAGYLGDARGYGAIGPSLSIRLGWDLFSWFSFGIHAAASSHEATVPPPPDGEWFQLYRGFADGRLGGRVGRIAFFVEGGAGIAYISSNILQKVAILDPGERYGFAFTGGGGVEYQLENRHYALGVAGDYWLIGDFAALQGIEARFYLRYTAD